MTFDDFVAIHNVMGRYGHIMDSASHGLGSWDDLGLIFTRDAVFDFTEAGGGVADGLDAIIGVMSGTDQHPMGHHFTNPVVESTGADEASCLSKIITVERNGAANSGHYMDHLVRTGDGWRIYRRVALVRFGAAEAERA